MANTAAGALAVCPFYLSDSKTTITCEGLTEKGKVLLVFEDAQQRKEWLRNNCYLYRCDCPLKKILNSKYE
jgi:hypothetical protein